MASSTLSTDRRWASSSRKSGMTVLGKVPKPINLPSQRLENNGLDPNVEIVPKGTITWGTTRPTSSSSSPSPNAWSTNTNTSLLSPKPGSPCTEPGRPVSSGSSPHTRPSTGSNTDRLDSLSDLRPNSSSGVLPIGQVAVLSGQSGRPRSADTRPGSGHLSRFAEAVEKSVVSTNEGGFTLSTGDFPTLGSEKPSESQRGHSSQGRPTSRDAKPKETLDAPLSSQNLLTRPMSGSRTDPRPKPPNAGDYSDPRTQTQTTQNVNILKTEDPSNSWYQSPSPYQSRPNLNPHVPLQYDSSWRAPPPQEPIWYGPTGPHGPGPHGPAGPHGPGPQGPAALGPGPHGPAGPHGPGPQYRPAGAYQVDPFVYYQPAPPHQFRAPVLSAESAATRPHMVQNPYMIPTHISPARPGAHAAYGPGSYDAGYYGPPRTGFYGNPNHHQNHNAPHQNTNHHYNNNHNYSNSYNKNNNNNQQQQPGILSQYGERPVSSSSVDSGPKQYKVLLKHREKKEDEKKDEIVPAVKSGDQSSETGSEKQNESEIQKKKDSLIQKIEGLNSKMRSLELVNKEGVKKKQTGGGILATPVSETGGSSSVRTGEDAERRANSEQRKAETDVGKGGDDGTVSDANLDPLDPAEYEILRLKLKEKAAQRARELQMEEEERIRQQRAKALAKLEELNRRLQKDPSNSSSEKQEESLKVSNDANMQKELSKISNEANVQKETQIVRNDKQQEPTKVIADSHFPKEPSKVANDVHSQKEPRKFANDNKHLQKEPRKFPNEKHHQRERQKVINDPNFQKEPLKSTNEKQPQQDPPKSTTDTNLQKESLKFSNEKQILQKVAETSSVPTTVTLSFGTFSGVQINSPEISVPTIVRTVQEAVPVSSHVKPHHHKNPTGYKKKHNNSNDSSETSTNEKSSNILTGTEPQNESHHKKRNNRNPKNKNKSDETVPVLVPVEERAVQRDDSKPEKNPNLKPTESSNPKQPHENPNFHNNRVGGNWKPQASRRPVRNPRNVPDKSHAGETVMWAPVKQSTKTNQSEESSNQNTTTFHNQSETETQTDNNVSGKTKRAEMERYVPKPQLERKIDEPTGEVLPTVESKTGDEGDNNNSGANNNNNNNNRSFRRGNNGNKPNSSWRQRAVVPVGSLPVQEEENRNTNTESVQDAKDYEEGNRKRNNNSGHKFYTATGNNYSGQGNSSNSGGIDVNMNEIGGEQTQHWKPKTQSKASNWQKVGDNNNEEGITVNSTQRGNERSNNKGFEEQKETNMRGTGEVGLEGRPSRFYRGRGRGRNGNYARE